MGTVLPWHLLHYCICDNHLTFVKIISYPLNITCQQNLSKLFRERTNIGKAFITAVIGALVWVVVYYLFGHGLLAIVLGGIAWLLALKGLYGLSWTKAAIIAVIIWIVSYFVTVAIGIPTAAGPL